MLCVAKIGEFLRIPKSVVVETYATACHLEALSENWGQSWAEYALAITNISRVPEVQCKADVGDDGRKSILIH
jgi:hypothetical protein